MLALMLFKSTSKFFAILLALLFILYLTISICFTEANCIDNIKIMWSVSNLSESLSLFKSGDIYYAFLPSYTNTDEIKIALDDSHKVYIDGIESEFVEIEIEHQYNIVIKNFLGITVCNEKLLFIKSANIGALSIQITNGTIQDINNDKSIKKSGTIQFINSQAETFFNGSFKAIHGRGNSSWEKEKKPYIIEFETPVNLGGFGAIQEYCLIASANENSCLRNKIAYELANAINLGYSPRSDFVDLYIDGNYYGLYLLVEKIDVAQNQIDIYDLENQTQKINQFKLDTYPIFKSVSNGTEKKAFSVPNNPDDISGGYLVELEYYARLLTENTYFTTKSGLAFNVKHPNACTAEQIEYISNYFQQAENSLSTQEFYKYIDVQSWAKYYLIQEFLANTDQASCFFYKNSDAIDSKIYAGPVWDFDLSMGLGKFTDGINETVSPYRYYVNNRAWFADLYNQPLFQSVLKEIYTSDFRNIIHNFLSKNLDEYYAQIEKSWIMNQLRWQNIQTCEWFNFPPSLQGNIDIIRNFLIERIKCFDSKFIENKPLIKISLKSETAIESNSYFYVAYNSSIDMLYPLSSDNYTFLGWQDESGKPFDSSSIFKKDAIYYAAWENASHSQQTNSNEAKIITPTHVSLYISFASFLPICIIIIVIASKNILSKINKRDKNGKKS